MLKPIIAMLHNLKLNKWHPILFLVRPLPGEGGLDRWKSKNHHTAGFDTRKAAVAFAKTDMLAMAHHFEFGEETKFCLEKDFPWDGEGVPAMVVFFITQADGTIVPGF